MGNDSSKKYLQLFKKIKKGVDNIMEQEERFDEKHLSFCDNCSCRRNTISDDIAFTYERINRILRDSNTNSSLRGVSIDLRSSIERLFKKVKAKRQLFRNAQCRSIRTNVFSRWSLSCIFRFIGRKLIECNLKKVCSIKESDLRQQLEALPNNRDLMRKFVNLEAMFQKQEQHLNEINTNITNSTPGSRRRTLPLDPPEF